MSQNEKKKIKIGVLSGLHHSHDHGLSIDEGRTFLSSYCAIQDYNTNPNRKFDIEPLYLNICDEVHVAFDIAKRLLKCEPPITALIVQSKKINSFLVPLFAGKPFGKQIPIYESQTNLIEFSSSQLFGSVTEPILREWNYFNAMIELMNAFDWRIYNLISSFESSSDTASCIKKSITKPNNKDHKTKVKEFPNDSECSKVPQIDCSYRLKDIETVLDENGYEDIDASLLKAEKDPLLLKSIDNVIKCLENSSSHILILWLKQMTVRWIIKKFSEKESLSNLQLIIMSGPQGNFRSADWAENISFPNNSNLMQGLIQIYQVKPDTQLNRDKYHRCIERLRPESHPFVARIWENIFRCNIPDEFFPQGNESHNDLGIPKNNGKYSKTCDMRGNQKLTDVMRKSNRAAFSYLTLESIVKAVDDDGYIRTKSGKQLHQFQSNYQSSTKFYYRQYQPGDDLGKQKKLDRAAIRFNYNFKLHQNKIPEYLHNNFSTTYKNNYHGVCFGLLERDGIWIDPSKLSFSPNGISWRSAYKLKKNSRLTLLSLNILLGVVLLCCLMIHIIFYVYRKEKVVRRTGIYLSHLILLGIELCLISQSIWSLEWNTGYICSIKVCMLALGTGLTVGSVVARFMRLHLIFNRLIKFNRNPRVSSPNKYNKNRSKKCRIKQDASERQTNSNLSLDSKEFESQETELDIFSDSISNNYKPANSVEARHSKSILNQIHRPVKFTTGLIKKLPLMETSKIHLHNAIVINDLYLITRIILPIILIECILVSMLFGLPFKFRWPTPKVYDYHTVSEAVIHCYGCDESYEFLAVIALYVFNGALAFAALYLSYLTRNISMEFNEAIGLAMISYFYFLCALLFFPLYISMYMRSEPAQEQVNRQLTLSRAGGIFICALVTILILFIPKVGYILVNRNKFVRFIIRRPLRLFFASKNAEMKAPTNSIEDEDSDISVIKLNITDDALTESESHGKLKVPKDRLISLSSTGSSTLEDVLSEFGIDESFSSTQSAGLE